LPGIKDVKLYRFWAVGEATVQDTKRPWKVRAYGASSQDMDDARRRARDAAERVVIAIARGARSHDEYGYADRPMREEIVQEIRQGDELVGAITRNSYGSLVLNTRRVMFADVDLYPANGPRLGTFGLSVGDNLRELWDLLRGRPSSVRLARESRILDQMARVVQTWPQLGRRVYRTAAGFRLLATSVTFDPVAAETQRLLTALGSDPLYRRLCQGQECFRARLSAKFWRCGVRRPPSRFPWDNASEEEEYREWEQEYHRQANRCATCQLVDSPGNTDIHEDVQPVLEMHDRLTMLDGAPLA
jgi:hypothetical protein